MVKDEKARFYERIEGRVQLNSDLRAGLREAILTNQTLKALVYIELLFDELDNSTTTTTTPTKAAAPKPKRAAKAKAEDTKVEETGETKDDKE